MLEVNGRKIKATEVQTAEPNDPRRNVYRDLARPIDRTAGATADFVCKSEPIRVFMGGNRRDITTLLPNDEIQIFMRWKDFEGHYVMHCHNVVHEDHAMMGLWNVQPDGDNVEVP